MPDLSAFLRHWMLAYGVERVEQINAGLCEEFAIDLAGILPGAVVRYTEDHVSWDDEDHPGGHAWVVYNGLCYDAQCLTGVPKWDSLPFFAQPSRSKPEFAAQRPA